MSALLYFFLTFGLFSFPSFSEGLECYSCKNGTSTKACLSKITCSQGEKCYTSARGIGASQTFDLGCKPEKDCLHVGVIGIVGRSISSSINCLQCCQVDNCNKNLCSSGTPVISEVGNCTDDPSFDCAGVSSLLNLCADVHHAKLKCRKYCGLCNLVDGSWSQWGSWSKCDVTCGSGHKTRNRTCTDPAPAHGGLDCVGDITETESCNLSHCPVHGGWALWSSWGYCSVTCGVGIQRRDRTCSNPFPGPNGDHCYGDSRDDRPCFVKACSDGVWSAWSVWGSCSARCSGLQQRKRTCNSPSPSNFGHACIGNNEEYQTCKGKNCTEVTFKTKNVNTAGMRDNQRVTFRQTVLNMGGSYNSTTGIFTAPLDGVYMFIVHACVLAGRTMYVNLMKDGNIERREAIYQYNSNDCHSFSELLSLTIGNEVWVTYAPVSYLRQDSNYVNIFQGTMLSI